jgi:tRNA/rRNA methyltransferase
MKPVIVLIDPQLGENIGAAARAMLNCGLDELRLVRPRDGWPNPSATSTAVGALEKMPPVRVFDTTAAALADCHFVLATTARARDMLKPVYGPRDAARMLGERSSAGQKTAILFGPERAGMENDDVTLAHGIITIPLNPGFSSLNLGQAVLLMAYEWSQLSVPPPRAPEPEEMPATHEKLMEFFERFEAELEAHNFFRPGGHKPNMIRNLRNMLSRASMTDQEVRTFHGIVTALTGRK